MRDDADIAAAALRLVLSMVDNNQSELARICGCTQGAVWQMLNKPAPRLSVGYVLRVERQLGVSRHQLRPDIYGPDPQLVAPDLVAVA